MIDRHKRGALPAGGDVGGAEIIHHRDMDRPGQRRRIADLYGHLLRRPMQHGLTVKSDNVDIFARDVVLRGKSGDRLRMRERHRPLGLPQDAGPRIAPRQVDGFRQRLPQQAALVVCIRPVAGRPERLHPPAVGFDQGDVDPVERGYRSSDRLPSSSWK